MSVLDGMCLLLAEAGVGAYSPGVKLPTDATPIAVGGMPAGNGPAYAVTTYAGGPEPDSRNGWEFPRMQVRVRHRDPLAALDLDRAAYDALQFKPGGPGPRTLPGDLWELQDCHALQSEAQPLGIDSNGRWEYVRNYQLECRPA